MALVIVGCSSGTPTSPTPSPTATPAPTPAPTSWITIDEVSPASGSTVVYSYSSDPKVVDDKVRVSYRFSFDPNIPGRVASSVYFSVDCESTFPWTAKSVGGGSTGSFTASINLPKESKIQKTACIIARLEQIDENWNVLQVVAEFKKPHELFFQEKK